MCLILFNYRYDDSSFVVVYSQYASFFKFILASLSPLSFHINVLFVDPFGDT